jgi:hypothetical protein
LNNLKLMRQVQSWNKNGARVLLLGYLQTHGSQDEAKVLVDRFTKDVTY